MSLPDRDGSPEPEDFKTPGDLDFLRHVVFLKQLHALQGSPGTHPHIDALINLIDRHQSLPALEALIESIDHLIDEPQITSGRPPCAGCASPDPPPRSAVYS